MIATDILLDDDMNYQIENGDFKIGESDYQSATLVLNTNEGSWKGQPFCGMGIAKYEGAANAQLQMKREIMIQLRADGFRVNSVIIKDYSNFYLDIDRN